MATARYRTWTPFWPWTRTTRGLCANGGLALGTMGRLDEAISDYDRSLFLEPDNPEAIAARGVAYDGQQRYETAIQDFTRAIELDPGSAQVFYDRGMTHGNLGAWERASDGFRRRPGNRTGPRPCPHGAWIRPAESMPV